MIVPKADICAPTKSLAIFDGAAFFEKTLAYGIAHGILSEEKLDAIQNDAPKGMVQIARYFGSEFLRPELEKAKDRIVNLVSLNLELQSSGDLQRASLLLRDHSFLSRSKSASDMLKALIVMPQSSHFGMNELSGFSDKHIPQLAKWSLCSLNEYQAELAKRMKVSHLIDAACWLASTLGLESDELEEAGPDAEAVIRTALLALHCKQKQMPDWPSFVRLIGALRKSPKKPPLSSLPKSLPAEYHGVVEGCLQSLQSDWEKILDTSITPTKLFQQTPAFVGRYFWIEDSLAEIDHFDREASTTWNKLTQGHSDDSSLLTLFICIAAGSPRKTLISEKSAVTLVRKIRKSSWQPDAVVDFIQEHAPVQHQSDYIQMWEHFVQEATATLLSDHDYQLHDALSLLKSECNIST